MNIINEPHFSALKSSKDGLDEDNLRELERYQKGDSKVFRWDMAKSVPPNEPKADALMSEIAWPHGFKKFMEKAKAEDFRTYSDYIGNIKQTIENHNLPTFMLGGRQIQKALKAEHFVPIRWRGVSDMYVLVWNADPPEANTQWNDIMNFVTKKYGCTWDFCCGYGNVLRRAKLNGNGFIGSDVNGKCIYHVAKEMLGYEG